MASRAGAGSGSDDEALCSSAIRHPACGRVRCLLGGQSNATLFGMSLKARVRAGRLVVDEPTDLPEGTEVDLLALDPGDWLDDADRERLHAALRDSNADVATGRLSDAAEVLASLRSR